MAVLQPGGRWSICQLAKAFELSTFFSHLKLLQVLPGCILSGFDFPIGVPFAYASKVGFTDFLTFLLQLGQKEWGEFFLPAKIPAEISLHRPFYPFKPGASKRSHLETGLGIPFPDLFRLCETRHNNRRAACPLFWTLGGQQVGKAASVGWRELLTPALSDPAIHLKIWPFSGSLSSLCLPGNAVVVETYPAEFYTHLGLSFSSSRHTSKRRRSDRLFYAHYLLDWSERHTLDLDPSIVEDLRDGFGNGVDGEDRFDAIVGLYGMINVVQGFHPSGEPLLPHISNIEGWIFGQEGSGREVGVSRTI